MEAIPRHQCLVYEGAPSLHLTALARAVRDKLRQNYRCLYLNTRPMVAGMQSYLAAEGVDVGHEVEKRSLLLTSEQAHLTDGRFDVKRMLKMLEEALAQALNDGYAGLWATGDMSWEMGSEKNLAKLLAYEWRLERFLQAHPEMGGICQYRADTLPREAVRQGLTAHPAIFLNETLSILNPHYTRPEDATPEAVENPALDAAVWQLWQQAGPA